MTPASATAPSLRELTRVFLRIGLLSFGGPAGQIALMHRELVEERPWLSEPEFLRALSFCMLLPGPEATQLATFAGWRLHGYLGGLIAGWLFVLPGAAVIFALAFAYGALIDLAWVQAIFLGVKATVVVIVVEAILRVARRALKQPAHWALAGLAFVAIFLFAVPFPLVVLAAGLFGAATAGSAPRDLARPRIHPATLALTLALGLALWGAPVALTALADQGFLTDVGLFFSKLAVVTFGGAYAVLSYLAQEVVSGYGWVSTSQVMDALGLAETTPGPLILVTAFVAITAGLNQGSALLALAAGLMAIWVTFVPCFLWIFAGAPLVDWLEGQPRLRAALTAITAAVVGVILNLSVWFALHVLFAEVAPLRAGPLDTTLPDWSTFQPLAAALALVAAWLLLVRHVSMVPTLALVAALAAGLHLVGLT
ncbi:Chromate transport protein ChrA [Rubellimicrobium mesophilum DSM 19309]|uniref:Chromate transport protein ChrA n=1 Tax=Rubellimicrobium mesophilum DSM 19309 TaxID=442562 RepID=A0A017HU57_9RHOB|nr:chromate efflux transporter [Rubellimicrobium mesophilum]EYD77870.1 Chromate transport protein ChrA [Rubellimicrobium mesophilum DSM 19309]